MGLFITLHGNTMFLDASQTIFLFQKYAVGDAKKEMRVKMIFGSKIVIIFDYSSSFKLSSHNSLSL